MLTALLDHKKLEKEMEARALKQEEFAERIGITDRHIRNLKERDTDVSSSLLYRISKEFGLPMESMLVLKQEDEAEG